MSNIQQFTEARVKAFNEIAESIWGDTGLDTSSHIVRTFILESIDKAYMQGREDEFNLQMDRIAEWAEREMPRDSAVAIGYIFAMECLLTFIGRNKE
jgi:hypothetical protein